MKVYIIERDGLYWDNKHGYSDVPMLFKESPMITKGSQVIECELKFDKPKTWLPIDRERLFQDQFSMDVLEKVERGTVRFNGRVWEVLE